MIIDKVYPVAMEIAGRMASFAIPHSGSEQTTYPIMTPTAAKGILEAVLFLRHAEIIPVMLHICSPIRYMETDFNYRYGPLRTASNIKSGNAARYQVSVLMNVRYQIFAVAKDASRTTAQHVSQTSRQYYGKTNHAHAYQEIFNRRLKKGAWFTKPTLGKSMCVSDYIGPLLQETAPCQGVNLTVATMVKKIFDKPFCTLPLSTGRKGVDLSNVQRFLNFPVVNGVAIFEPELVGHVFPLALQKVSSHA